MILEYQNEKNSKFVSRTLGTILDIRNNNII